MHCGTAPYSLQPTKRLFEYQPTRHCGVTAMTSAGCFTCTQCCTVTAIVSVGLPCVLQQRQGISTLCVEHELTRCLYGDIGRLFAL